MFAIGALIVFVVAALLAFGAISGITVIGLVCVGLALLAAHHVWGVAVPWHRG